MVYVDGFVAIVKKRKLKEYTKLAKAAGKFWKKHGALQYVETVGEEMKPDTKGMKMLTFPKLTKQAKDEVVIFSYIVYRNKKHRDSVNKKVMSDPQMKNGYDGPMPFDVKKMAWGGFTSIVKF